MFIADRVEDPVEIEAMEARARVVKALGRCLGYIVELGARGNKQEKQKTWRAIGELREHFRHDEFMVARELLKALPKVASEADRKQVLQELYVLGKESGGFLFTSIADDVSKLALKGSREVGSFIKKISDEFGRGAFLLRDARCLSEDVSRLPSRYAKSQQDVLQEKKRVENAKKFLTPKPPTYEPA